MSTITLPILPGDRIYRISARSEPAPEPLTWEQQARLAMPRAWTSFCLALGALDVGLLGFIVSRLL